MFYFKESADPVGKAHTVDAVESMVLDLKRLWDERKSKRSLWGSATAVSRATNFILCALDGLVNAVSDAAMPGPDKKATVLSAVDRLYEYVVREALPIWLVPIAGPIKSYIVYVLVSSAIDWLVSKYRSGSWSAPKSSRKGGRRAK